MPDEVQAVFHEISEQLADLRAAILANDIAALDFHTAQLRAKMNQLAPLLTESSRSLGTEVYSLRGQIRGTRSVLESARRTVNALTAIYRSFHEPHAPVVTEQR